MRQLELTDIETATKGKILSQKEILFQGIGTDTRQNLKGVLFIALKGDTFDAHDYLDKAVENGATGLLIDKENQHTENLQGKVTIIKTSDTLLALQNLGDMARHQSNVQVLALTGSNGKTSTKEFLGAILESQYKTFWNQGSFNNHWGVPMSLLQMPDNSEKAVIEMGMNHPGEITRLVQIADPDIVTVLGVGRAHIEHFGTVEKIAEAKEEIYTASRPDAVRIFNLDQFETYKMMANAKEKFPNSKTMSFSQRNSKADVNLNLISMSLKELHVKGTIGGVAGETRVPVFGAHNIFNLMGASAMALAAGMTGAEIWKALPRCHSTWGRNQFVELKSGAECLFDGYNANPDSVKALLHNIAEIKSGAKTYLILGQMKELGSHSVSLHEEIAAEAASGNFAGVVFMGAQPEIEAFTQGFKKVAPNKELHTFEDMPAEAPAFLSAWSHKGHRILVKGSRSMYMERWVTLLQPVKFEKKK